MPADTGEAPWPYQKRRYLLSRAELAFYHVLIQAVGDRYTVCPKVNLNDLLLLTKGTENRMSWLNKINRKHIDFVLCDPATMEPKHAVELDDASHQKPDAQARDAVKDRALNAAGLELVRIRARGSYDPAQLRETLYAAGQRTTTSA
ncbi:MAG: DUF2726 domain-containing protein [Planctomycetota bacterium]